MVIIRRSNTVSSIILILISLCIIAALITRQSTTLQKENSNVSTRNISEEQQQSVMSSQQQQQQKAPQPRHIVGGFSNLDTTLIQSEQVITVANFALTEHAAKISASSATSSESGEELFLAVSPEEVEAGAVNVVVLEAQRQVVAGLNYKLTIALMKDSICLGALKVTIYDHFGDLSVTKWGDQLTCEDVQELLKEVQAVAQEEVEEEVALEVEEKIEEGMEEVEPNE